jgi:uncharacterized membrane protein
MATVNNLIFVLTLLTALGCGLIAGVFFGFSSFIMTALGRVQPSQGIASMQSINIVVINPVFLGVFLGTAILCAVLVIFSLLNWSTPGSAWLLAGGLLYFFGTFVVTMAFNVPLNNALAAVDPASAEGARVWENYLSVWTIWNTVRTIGALAGMAALIVGLVYRSSPTVISN